ncbi:MAG: four helix bundle protein [Flavobacteriales bacterium]|nr:MAG: four helix bundle protein [Flavobacteriales bacterium]
MSIRPHKNLKVWQEAIEFVPQVYKILISFSGEEKFGLISQIKRASTLTSVNIVEGAERSSKKEFVRFPYYSSGLISELDTLFEISLKLNYLSDSDYKNIIEKLNKRSAMTTGLINSLKKNINE